MRVIKLFNTLVRQKVRFVPQDPKRVTLYVCGPTVYNFAHIGNGRPVVVFDTLFRLLRTIYGHEHVIYARNITDVDDRINALALEQGLQIGAITQKYTQIYHDDMAALGALPPTLEPKVTAHMDDIISLIGRLLAKDHAYQTEDGIYFSVRSMPNYGQLSGRKVEDNEAGARISIDTKKHDPADFALWKAAKPGEPYWEAPFGAGRPGWHIECSAMIESNLGLTIDIHGGGHDLIFPHHENEIAQSVCAHDGAPLAHIWMHNGFLTMNSDKMSKSLGNVELVHQLVERWPGEALRLALLSAHYRAPLDWTDELILQSMKTLDRLYRALNKVWYERVEPIMPDGILAALCDDLNTPKALAELSMLARKVNKAETIEDRNRAKAELLGGGLLLGILGQEPQVWLSRAEAAHDDADTNREIDAMVQARFEARANRNWAEADRLRSELAALGVEITDAKDGSSWRYTS
ncbi:cysteine--tRNA ligase [Candidatus Phycosocius spiralis]|uniref:Cysteine--tRNA ligase n=2 Tax=Candidatus Phycosocius spiralis TaxID=2815099 RepID=A0ABQ4PY10_9PROT|nr:cysteine--tRNA ligase [Candidatus Phycosocius spiralis]